MAADLNFRRFRLILEDSDGPQRYGIELETILKLLPTVSAHLTLVAAAHLMLVEAAHRRPNGRTTSPLRLRLHRTNSEEERANERSL